MIKACLAILMILICVIAQATPFLTGAYAQYDLPNSANHPDLKTWLKNGGYNAVTITNYDDDLMGLSSVLEAFGSEIKTILADTYWNPSSGQVGIHSLSYGNYLKMEAEYKLIYFDDLVPPDDTVFTFIVDELPNSSTATGISDVYNYVFAHADSCGVLMGPGTNSNQYAWACDDSLGHIPGKALSNPRFRWKVPSHTYPRSIGNDLKFHHPAIDDNRLFLTVAMKFDRLAVGEEVATIKLKVLNDVNGENNNEFRDYTFDESNYYEFVLHPVNSEVDTTIFNIDYVVAGLEPDRWGNFLFEYYIEFPDPDDSGSQYNNLLKSNGAGDFFLHINPEVYWHGNGRMEIDYIILEDEYHRRINANRHDDSMYSWLQVRMNNILSLAYSSNIIYHYTKDEPFQGQFSMYDKLESRLDEVYGSEISPKLVTATSIGWSNITKPDLSTYNHHLNFLAQTKPMTITIDAYPLYEGDSIIQWNCVSDSLSVQQKIDRIVTKPYKNLATAVRYNTDISTRNTEIIYIPQVYGEYVPDTSNNVNYWRIIKPPRSMNKCLQLLPLCYSADGILDFTLLARYHSLYESSYYRLAPLTHDDNYANIRLPDNDSAFEQLTEANRKIAVYGPYLKEQNWVDADCLMTYGGSDGVSVSPFYLSELRVKHPTETPLGGIPADPEIPYPYYTGYVQCGYYYNDDQQSPSFMLVNRRAVYRNSGENTVAQLPLDDNFVNASNQTVIFVPSPEAETHFGSNIGLYDPYDAQIYRKEGTDIRVSIGPGDGKMLEMRGTLPTQVRSDMTLRHKVCLAGDIDISRNSEVVIEPNTEVVILPKTHITLSSGSHLNMRGCITVGDSVRFTINDGSSVDIANAEYRVLGNMFIDGNGAFTIDGSTSCRYDSSSSVEISGGINATLSGDHDFSQISQIQVLNNSYLEFNNAVVKFDTFVRFKTNFSTLRIYSSEIYKTDNSNGASIVVDNMSAISIENSTIREMPLYVYGSSLDLQNSLVTVHANKTGIFVNNPDGLRMVRIVNNRISSESVQNTKGINIDMSQSPVVIRNTAFSGFGTGILKTTNAALPDSIYDCSFTDCIKGIKELSGGTTGRIENCTFTNTGQDDSFGIILSGSTPTIFACTFNACKNGIFFEGSFYAPRESGVYNSNFNLCDIAIETRSSNPIVENCAFYMNGIGLLCHDDSNANLSYNRRNSFRNLESNIQFYDSEYFRSYIQLYAGHNDFWHFGTPDQSIASLDFHFDDYYASSSGTAIDATKNWFEADSIMINLDDNPQYQDYVFAEVLDPSPNTMGTDPDGNNRYLVALYLEANGLFDQASTLYKIILDGGLESEKAYFSGCVDGLFRSSCLQTMQAEILATYLEEKINQFTPIDSVFCKLLSDYQIKAFVVSGNFQSAINIVQTRIDDPVSVIDSLRAVLDLEIILQLESMQESKKPLALKYTQYRYPNTHVYYIKHDEHLKELYRELNKGGEDVISIPPKAVISTNYPNPFNSSTTIAFSIPKDAKTKLKVYNIKGQKVKDIVNGDLLKGFHKAVWDGKDSRNRSVSSGIYLFKLESGGKTSVRKVTLMK